MKKVSDLKTAILYAQAMYNGALEDGQEDLLYNDARDFLDIIKEKKEDFIKLNNPLWKCEHKMNILQTISEKLKFSECMLNTLKLLAQNNKLNIVDLVLKQFILFYQEKHNIAEIEITTVMPLSIEQEKLLKQKLENIFHKQIMLHYIIDPQIIGGLMIKYGTNFIDNSIKHKLSALEQLMKGTK